MIRKFLEDQVTQPLSNEFFGAMLGDDRRRDRLCTISQSLSENPALSFPLALGGDAELEGTYRLLANPEVDWEAILKPHVDKTFQRLFLADSPLAIHDTTQLSFGGGEKKIGLGRLTGSKKKGFLCHVSLAVDLKNMLPLGVANMHPFRRLGASKGKRTRTELRYAKSKESSRWWQAVERVEQQSSKKVIHVMDREGDAYWLLSKLIENEDRFVIRVSKNRRIEGEESYLFEQMDKADIICEREVTLSKRKVIGALSKWKTNPDRKSRVARLGISSQTIVIKRARYVGVDLPKSLTVNVVLVKELSTPTNEEPVEWRIITTESIETVDSILRIVDIYRGRWIIEEFFKALKTGCSYEERQLESYHSLVNALAIFLPIAWRMLLLRSLERKSSKEPGTTFLTEPQISLLRMISKRKVPEMPTVHDVFFAIAGLGGHIKNNGDPGWQVLWRGYQKFLAAEIGWNAAMQSANAINR
jgi:hypothetical protein